jgi:hypothetical protein
VIGKASGPSAHPLCPSAVRLGARHSEDRVTEGHGPKRARVGRGCQLSDAADLDQFGVRVILLHCYSSHGVVFLCAEASQRLGLDGGEEISIDTRPSGIVLTTKDKYRDNYLTLTGPYFSHTCYLYVSARRCQVSGTACTTCQRRRSNIHWQQNSFELRVFSPSFTIIDANDGERRDPVEGEPPEPHPAERPQHVDRRRFGCSRRGGRRRPVPGRCGTELKWSQGAPSWLRLSRGSGDDGEWTRCPPAKTGVPRGAPAAQHLGVGEIAVAFGRLTRA